MGGDQREQRIAGCAEPRQSLSSAAAATMTSATTPNVPLRLSFMISSLRSRVLPPPKPSAISATPSSCRLPVTRIAVASATIAASDGGRPSQSPIAKAMPASRPTMAPATGAAQIASAKLRLAEAEPCGRQPSEEAEASGDVGAYSIGCQLLCHTGLALGDRVEECAGDVAAPAAERAERLALAVRISASGSSSPAVDHLRVVEFVAADRSRRPPRAGSRP